MPAPDPEKIARLRTALEDVETYKGDFFDRPREEALAPIRARALGLLDQRARSRSELRDRLCAAEFAPQLVDDVLDGLERSGLIDDTAFAREWVRQRAAHRGKAAAALDNELKQKGVAAQARQEALAQLTREDEEAAARHIAEKKVNTIRQRPADRAEYDKLLRRVVGMLARRGYDSALSLRTARDALNARLRDVE
ncbi:Regulatory protein RecX [Corynebacterium capitovis DSM 44611]|uniref:regulatory protein RecX n=1 Tax=Corynebacterium capitovis TaxID=131081 RepID=UPI000363CD2B|nr:regulatory protein RecX [Corynebacterium capitovis]WKD57502.1 Regulatory protein RecX [Corynebacterium capitovis DSM 44611]